MSQVMPYWYDHDGFGEHRHDHVGVGGLTMIAPRRHLIGTAIGLLADRYLGEPAIEPDPVAAFTSLMKRAETHVYADTRRAGAVHAAIGVGIGLAAGAVVQSAALATYVAVGGRAESEMAQDVAEALALDDIESARARLSTSAGLDHSTLDSTEIARAVVERVAEATSHTLVAPAVWSVVAGASGALTFRSINTLHTMVGHHDARYENFGRDVALGDYIASWVPERLTVALVMLARPSRAGDIWRSVRGGIDHPDRRDRLAGVAFAAALGVTRSEISRLAKPSDERDERRCEPGNARPASGGDIAAAIRLLDDVQLLLALTLLLAGAAEIAARTLLRMARRRR